MGSVLLDENADVALEDADERKCGSWEGLEESLPLCFLLFFHTKIYLSEQQIDRSG